MQIVLTESVSDGSNKVGFRYDVHMPLDHGKTFKIVETTQLAILGLMLNEAILETWRGKLPLSGENRL